MSVEIKRPLNGTVNYDQLVDAFYTLVSFTPRSMSFEQIRTALDKALDEYTDSGEKTAEE